MEMKNTYVELKLADDRIVKLTLNFYALLKLKSQNKELYDRYNKISMDSPKEELDMLTVMYTGYCCACILDQSEPMSEEEFLMSVFPDRKEIGLVVRRLMMPKRQPTVPASVQK